MLRRFAVFVLVFFSFLLIAKERLTLDQALYNRGEALTLPLPSISGWADDSHYIQIRGGQLFRVEARSGQATLVLDTAQYPALGQADLDLLAAEDYTPDWNRFVFLKDGDLHLFLRPLKRLQRISETAGEEKNPCFSPDGTRLAYTLSGNLYVYDMEQQKSTPLTEDGSEEILNGYASWVYYEEVLGRSSHYRSFWWSPDSRKIAFLRFDQTAVPVFPIFNAEGIYGTLEKQRYPKPGFPNPRVKLGIVDLASRKLEWIVPNGKEDDYLTFPVWNQSLRSPLLPVAEPQPKPDENPALRPGRPDAANGL